MRQFAAFRRIATLFLGAITILLPAFLMAQEHAAPAAAPTPFIVEEHIVKKISDHVYEIPDRNRPGVPNVVIVIGSRASLVLDTGMGQKSGEIVLHEVQRLTKSTELYPRHKRFSSRACDRRDGFSNEHGMDCSRRAVA